MTNAGLTATLRHIKDLATADSVRNLTDQQLLQDFLTRHNQTAFSALVRRHGALVLGVCSRALRSAEDAEDAFQATFLLLVRKGASIRKHESVGSWLFGVAYRIAQNAKRAAARRRVHKRKVGKTRPQSSEEDLSWREVQAVLDEEIQRLPEIYRGAFILCYLDGRGRAAAAAELLLKEKTLEKRLAKARLLLRRRLARRGVNLSAVLTGLALTSKADAVPATLISSTMNGIVTSAAGGVAPAKVLILVRQARWALFVGRLKVLLAAAVVAAVACSGAVLIASYALKKPIVEAQGQGASGVPLKNLVAETALERGDDLDASIHVEGRILDPEGKPFNQYGVGWNL